MAELTQEEQVDVVHRALLLETAITVEESLVLLVKDQQFDRRFPDFSEVFSETPPDKPQRQICEAPAPVVAELPAPPKASYSPMNHFKSQPVWIVAGIGAAVLYLLNIVMWRSVFLSAPALPAAFIIPFFLSYFKEKTRRNQELANTPEYQQSVAQAQQLAADKQAQIDKSVQEEQGRLDSQYEDELEHYNTVMVPAFEKEHEEHRAEYAEMRLEYERDKAEWEEKKQETITKLNEDRAANKASLEKLYDTSKIISIHYREIPILEWLYDDMRTSDHDIRYATELLDRDRQRIAVNEAADRTIHAIDCLESAVRDELRDVKELQGMQIEGLQNLESVSQDLLNSNEDLYASSKKILFHQRVSTVATGAREWRRHKRR